MSDIDPETITLIDIAGALAYAKGMGESIAAFYTTMIEHGLPEDLAKTAFLLYMESRFGIETEVDEGDEEVGEE
jgi:hypothetical protein